ncbi:phosphatidate cytidylyltransferase [uncultured Cytophaga sp.]|uniref:phosphatidate cytidylyltransferase n=1 Tax=uncultured Cytophaga sp. TaxID=160238 RepID=UPI00260E7FB5|nr:phosphatidate cytidylyltransferase [uncultured Cytophaga sp.]
MSNLLQRTITGILGAAFMLFAIWFNYISFIAIFFLVNIFSLYEYYQLLKKSNIGANASVGTIGGIAIFILFVLHEQYLPISTGILLAATCLLFMVLLLVELFSINEQPLSRVAYTIFGILYISLPLSLFTKIPLDYHGFNIQDNFPIYRFEIIYAILFLIWANDIGAYFAGKYFGKHKLFERISPKKTWEGSAGGLLTAILFTYLLYTYIGIFSIPVWIGLCIVTVIAGSLGDLVESMIKRTLNVKDSGTLLPGHGGFLDRFDALIFAIPFIYLYLNLAN